ncbi:MAG: hypothetical protein JXA11_07265, partial [Phycisphaerae bacterium]|nr:hypothetical protein [Phycisphaerae bacterium]
MVFLSARVPRAIEVGFMDSITIALAGNPNCGKTTLFNA